MVLNHYCSRQEGLNYGMVPLFPDTNAGSHPLFCYLSLCSMENDIVRWIVVLADTGTDKSGLFAILQPRRQWYHALRYITNGYHRRCYRQGLIVYNFRTMWKIVLYTALCYKRRNRRFVCHATAVWTTVIYAKAVSPSGRPVQYPM